MKKLLSNSESNEHLKYFMSRELQNHKLIFPLAIINYWHHYANSPYHSQNIFQGADKENLFNNQESLYLVITAFILMTLMFDSEVIL